MKLHQCPDLTVLGASRPVKKSCDIEDTPSLTGVLAHFRSHEFNAIGIYAGEAKAL